MKLIEKFSKTALIVGAVLLMTACGGDDADTPPVAQVPAPVVVAGSATGTLTDAAVGGVAYTTSSGVAGTTAADGSYQYNPGDTVTFKLGALTLGTATATGIVTPMELSGGSAVVLQNLLVLLQSLDSDRNPANGITIPAGAAAAVTASANLSGSTSTFAADSGVQAAMTAGGISGSPTSNAMAGEHFVSQGLALLSRNIWVNQSADSGGQTHTVILRIDASGRYTQIETGASESVGGETVASSGVEAGTLSVAGFSPQGYNVTATIASDSNGEWGASSLQACDRFRNVGEQLVTSDCESSRGLFGKMPNVDTAITGAWYVEFLDDGELNAMETYYFPNGSYVVSYYKPGCAEACASEARSGTYALADGMITTTVDGRTSRAMTYSLSADGKQLVIDGRTERTMARVSR